MTTGTCPSCTLCAVASASARENPATPGSAASRADRLCPADVASSMSWTRPPRVSGVCNRASAPACSSARDARFAAFELVEYNPRHDQHDNQGGGITAHLALDLLGSVAGALHAQRREYASAA